VKTGRPRTPTNLKLIKGSYRKDRALKGEPKPAPALPEPPEFLSPGAKQEWNRVAPELHKLGLLSQIDVAALSCYCEAWSDFVDASKRCIHQPLLRHQTPVGRNGVEVCQRICNDTTSANADQRDAAR
jgi:phage terminase small subunit